MLLVAFIPSFAAHIRGVAGSIPATATNPLNNATEASCLTTRDHPRVASDTGLGGLELSSCGLI